MSTLVVQEVDLEVVQEIERSTPVNLYAIRPHLYIHNAPAGSLKIQVRDSNGYLVGESETLTIANIKTDAGAGNFYHGYVRFLCNIPLMANTVYQVVIVGTAGYAFNSSAYVGVCCEFENRKYAVDYSPNDGTRSPLDIEFWERVNKWG